MSLPKVGIITLLNREKNEDYKKFVQVDVTISERVKVQFKEYLPLKGTAFCCLKQQVLLEPR